jgi:hypothetical protein
VGSFKGKGGGRKTIGGGEGKEEEKETPGSDLEFGSLAGSRTLFIGVVSFTDIPLEVGNAIECPRMV